MEQPPARNGLHEWTRNGHNRRSEWVRRQGLEPRTRRLRVGWSYSESTRSACDFTVLPAEICNRSPGFGTGSCRLLPGSTGTSEQPWSNHGRDRLWLMNDRPAIPDRAAALPLSPGGGYGLLFLLVAGESGLVVPADSRQTIPPMHRSRRRKCLSLGRRGRDLQLGSPKKPA